MSAFDDLLTRLRQSSLPKPTTAKNIQQQLGASGLDAGLTALTGIGSVRRLKDISLAMPIDKNPADGLALVRNVYNNYIKKTWATDADPLVKHIDQGGTLVNSQGIGPLAYPVLPRADLNKIAEQYQHPPITKFGGTPVYSLSDALQQNLPIARDSQHYIESIQSLADKVRASLGTSQSASTPAGRLFENLNDLKAVSQIDNKLRNIPKKFISDNPHASPDIIAYDNLIKTVKSNPYYMANKDDINVFNTVKNDYWDRGKEYYLNHINDVAPVNNRMSLVDMLQHTITADNNAVIAAEKARLSKVSAAGLADKELLHKFDDGTSWNKLSSPDALQAEGEYQGHCAGSYAGKVANGKSAIYSLRDATNKPVLTAEHNPLTNSMAQVKGKYNSKPAPEYAPHIDQLKSILGVK